MTGSIGQNDEQMTADHEPIAIVGMAGVYPKAPDKDMFWKNILDCVDAVGEAPADWHGDLFLDPDSSENDRVYTTKGGFLGDLATFDPLRHGVMPTAINGGEPDQFLALEMAANAIEDAGFDQRPVPGDRVAVILGRGTYINRGFTSVVQHGIMVDRFLQILKQLHPDTAPEELAEVKKTLKASLPPFNAEIAPALVPNLVTGRISNRLDFRGTNYIVDAACASSLIALERGVVDLRDGRCDMAIVGGVHASTPAPIYQIFCQLEALSKKGSIKPFSEEADGTLLGEGVGLLCIKRLSDAEAAGDRIYALVRGVGVASDGKGLGILAPRIEGEGLALSRAYEDANVDPKTVGLIEAHGTATSVGDATEVEALSAQFGGRNSTAPDCALGAVKSMIGHCLPASGSAGLIKTAMALYHKTLPPTLVDTPNPKLGLDQSPFYLNTEARPWIHGADTPRRAGVNAFGFGGINAHAVLEEYTGAAEPAPLLTRTSEVIAIDAADQAGLVARIDAVKARLVEGADLSHIARAINAELGDGDLRGAVVATSVADAVEKLDKIAARLAKGKTKLRDRKGVYLTAEPLAREGKVAFMFPGEGSQHIGMLRELMLHFPVMRGWFDLVDGAFKDHPRNLLPSQVFFPPPTEASEGQSIWRMDIGPEAIFAANQAVAALYSHIGLSADMLVGHSTGEYSALYAAGVTRRDDPAQLQSEMRALNDAYEVMSGDGVITWGTLIAIGAVDGDKLNEMLSTRDDVYLAMDNCPNQKVIAAYSPEARDWVLKIASELGGFAEALPFERAYHSPAFQGFTDRLNTFLQDMEISAPEAPVYSCLSTGTFADTPDDIRKLTADQWAGRVRFTETIRKMHDDGARIFVECGPRNNLASFVDDILRRDAHLSLSVDTAGRTGLDQFNHFAAQLAVEGVDFDLSAIAAPLVDRPEPKGPRRPQVLKMGIQPMELTELPKRAPKPAKAEVITPKPDPAPAPAPVQTPAPTGVEAVVASYFDTMERFVSTEGDIMQAYFGAYSSDAAPAPAAPVVPAAVAAPTAGTRFPLLASVDRSPDNVSLTAQIRFDTQSAPFLKDHSFGRGISQLDPNIEGLAVVPLTFSMEILAEAAAALRPDLVVTGMREVRASRWLALDKPVLAVEATAELQREGDPTVIRVRLRDAEGPKLRPILVEADVELRPALPAAPKADPMSYGAKRDCHWTLDDVYSRIMFHGPKLQAVENMDMAATDGAEGVLRGMPFEGLLTTTNAPRFETDAITLDAVGQLVGVWSAEMLDEAFHIFPFRVERVEIFRAPLGPGERARCRCGIALVGEDEMRSYIDVVTEDGRLQCRIEGWWDKRFNLPDNFYRARLDPANNSMSAPIAPFGDLPEGVRLTRLDGISTELLDGSGGIWAKVLANLTLSAEERADWAALSGATAKRKWEWLRGRVAAKDAVRFLKGAILPADVSVIAPGEDDGPRLGAIWPATWGSAPHVSITHKGEFAMAAAADADLYDGVGIDVETIAPRGEAFITTAFAPSEQAHIAAQPEGAARDLFITRMWCAKEAAAKSFGVGLGDFARFAAEPSQTDPETFEITEKSSGALVFVNTVENSGEQMVAALAVRRKSGR